MADQPAKHGHQHGPDGPDPIPITSGLPVAVAGLGPGTSKTLPGGGVLALDFQRIYWNDDAVFGFGHVTGTTPKFARFITVKESGVYEIKAMVTFNSAFSASDAPFIQTRVWYASDDSEDELDATFGNGIGSFMPDEFDLITTQQDSTDDMLHHALQVTSVVNVDLNDLGETEFGFGVGIGASVDRAKVYDPYLVVTKLGDLMTQQTIA